MSSLQVCTLFQTSRGTFLTKEEASKKSNRQKETDPRYDIGYEPVREVRVLKFILDNGNVEYFSLSPLLVTRG